MADLANVAQPAIDKLLPLDETRLYEELGKRLMLLQNNPAASGNFDLPADFRVEAYGPLDIIIEFGRDYFQRVNSMAYALMCGSDLKNTPERKKIVEAFGIGADTVAPALAALLVAHLALAPAVAAALAVLVVKLFYAPGHDAMCKVWKEHLS